MSEQPAGRSYLANAKLLAFMTLISRILGLIRDMAMASLFGAYMVLDAWVLAFTVPNLFRRLFGEGALSAAFIPTFAKAVEGPGPERARRVLSLVSTLLVSVLAVISILGVGACLSYRAYASPDQRTELFCLLLAVLLPYVIFICLTALLSGALNTLDHFLLPSLTPIVFNLIWIAALGWLMQRHGMAPRRLILILAAVVTVAGMVQVALLLPALARRNYLPRPAIDTSDQAVRTIARSMGPIIFGVGVFQLNVLADRLIAWLLIDQEGALSVLYLGNRLMQFPLGIIGIAMGTAVFPLLSRLAAVGRRERFIDVLTESIEVTLFLAVPASVGLILIREPLIRLFFEHREFTAQASGRTAMVLMFYSIGIWATCLTNLGTRGFYSLDEVRTPVRIGVWMVLLNVGLNLALVFPMAEAGLALATALTHVVNAVVLLWALHVRLSADGGSGGLAPRPLLTGGLRVLVLSLVMSGVVALTMRALETSSQASRLFVPVAAGLASYLLLSWLFAPNILRKLLSQRGQLP